MMRKDRLFLHISSTLLFVILLLTLFFPLVFTRIVLSLIIIPITVFAFVFIKKRDILSVHKREVLIILSILSTLYLGVYYLTGLYFGFNKSAILFSFPVIYRSILPLSIIIVGVELIRYVFLAQRGRIHKIIFFISCVLLDIAIYANVNLINTFDGWINIFGNVVIGAVSFNLLFNYISKRYGFAPNLVFRLLITLYPYIIPVVPNMPDILVVFCKMLVPFLIYILISATYGRKGKVVSHRRSTVSTAIVVGLIIIMVGAVMIISNAFGIGMLVIGSGSMSGTIEKGDIIFYEVEDDFYDIEIQDVIVFKKDGTDIVHRVIDKYIINGEYRYITKGDANMSMDTGYVTQGDIVGVVTNFRLRGLGWPTLWLHDLFK